MIRLRGGNLVLADRVVTGGVVVIDGGRIADVGPDRGAARDDIDCTGGWLVPGFIDCHIHGADGTDVLEDELAVARVAAALPRHGVTGFCPTSVACDPATLSRFLDAVGAAASATPPGAARVLGAHLESNFITPDYRGAQPAQCLRRPPVAGEPRVVDGEFSGAAILEVIATHRSDVRIVTVAPELAGGLELVASLAAAGHRVSLGHSAATFEQGQAAIAAGARHATHLFNRMPPLGHRAPGLAGAVLADDRVTCEIVCDGHHVHPDMIRLAVRAKGRGGVLAITDATAGAGLTVGSTARLGAHEIHVRDGWAELADGTLAGSVLTMDRALRLLVERVGLDLVAAVDLCATAPARAVGRPDLGVIEAGRPADLVLLDDRLCVRQTWVGGVPAWNSAAPAVVNPTGGRR